MAKKNHTINETETAFAIAGIRRYLLQLDTKTKYAESDDEAEALRSDIEFGRNLLAKLGDAKKLVLKSEREPKKAKAKATKKASTKVVKAKATKVAEPSVA